MTHRSFNEVSKTTPPGGWKHAPDDGDHMLFARAESLARLCAFNTRSVYEWAVRENNDLKNILASLGKGKGLVTDNPLFGPLFDAVILGMPFNPPTP